MYNKNSASNLYFFRSLPSRQIFLTIISPISDSILFFLKTFLKTTKSGFGRSVDIGYNITKEFKDFFPKKSWR
jgi:hypothetical protein